MNTNAVTLVHYTSAPQMAQAVTTSEVIQKNQMISKTKGTWRVSSEVDPRWNNSGETSAPGYEEIFWWRQQCRVKFGPQPEDLVFGFSSETTTLDPKTCNLMKRRPSINIGVEHDVNYNVRDSEGNFIHETQS